MINIDDLTIGQVKEISKMIGSNRETESLAKRSRDKMRVFNRLLAYVDEHAPDWEPNWKTDPNWYVYFNHNQNIWEFDYSSIFEYACTVYMPEKIAKKLVDDLNNGRVEL